MSTSVEKMPPLLVRPREARRLLGDCGQKQIYELLNAGELESFREGRARKIVTASIDAYIQRRLAGTKGGANR